MLAQVDWENLGKIWGPLGIGFVLAVVLVLSGARLMRGLLLGTIEDARKEQDYMRAQREREADRFIESLKLRDGIMKEGFDEILQEMRDRRR